MKRLVRLVRFGVILIWFAARMSVAARRLPRREAAQRVAELQQIGSRHLCHVLGVTVVMSSIPKVMGRTLYVCNHVGLLDPWILASQLRLAFAAKVEMNRWPIFGWIGRSTGLIYVDRKRRLNTGDFVEQVQQRMDDGVGVLVFPEGTTNAYHDLLPFRTGGFEAVAEIPDAFVQPLYIWARRIDGTPTSQSTRRLVAWPSGVSMWRNAWSILGLGTIEIEVLAGEQIGTGRHDRKELARLSQDQVEVLKRSTESSEI